MEKRSLFDTLFGKPKTINTSSLRLLNGYTPMFSGFSGDIYESDVARSAIHAIASNTAKLKPQFIRKTDLKLEKENNRLNRLLQVRPNPYMSSYDFLYKIITQLYVKNNAFVYIQIVNGQVVGFYPINFSSLELVEDSIGNVYAKFMFIGGQQVTLPYTDLIHLRRFFYKHDFYGEPNDSALNPTLELINTTNQGIMNAVKSSAVIRGILKFTQAMLKPEDIKRERDRFVTEYLSIDNNGGIGALDAKAEFQPMNIETKIIDDKQMMLIRDNVYRYFNINDQIVTSKYNENEWNAFYESVIEPLSIQLSLEFTAKCFTDREIGFGNQIMFEANRLQYASNQTKISIIETLMPLGLLSMNQALDIFNLPPIEGGEKRLQSLNFVDADKVNEYQGVNKKEGDKVGSPNGEEE